MSARRDLRSSCPCPTRPCAPSPAPRPPRGPDRGRLPRAGRDARRRGVAARRRRASAAAAARKAIESLAERVASEHGGGAGRRARRHRPTPATGRRAGAALHGVRRGPVAAKTAAQAPLPRPARQPRPGLRRRSRRHRQDLPGGGPRGQLLLRGRGRPADRHPPGGGGRRAAGLPARRPEREGRPLHGPGLGGAGDILGAEALRRRRDRGEIEVAPIAFMRGRTLSHAFVIVDEAQNASRLQMKMVLTRLGEGARMAVTGDPSQVDLVNPRRLRPRPRGVASSRGSRAWRVARFRAADVVRHPLVERIVARLRRRRRRG